MPPGWSRAADRDDAARRGGVPAPSTSWSRGAGERDFDAAGWARCGVRTRFDAPPGADGRRVFLDFAAAMTRATVTLNGAGGHHLGGYLPFSVEMTGLLRPGRNVLAVRLDSGFNLNVPPDRPAAGAQRLRGLLAARRDLPRRAAAGGAAGLPGRRVRQAGQRPGPRRLAAAWSRQTVDGGGRASQRAAGRLWVGPAAGRRRARRGRGVAARGPSRSAGAGRVRWHAVPRRLRTGQAWDIDDHTGLNCRIAKPARHRPSAGRDGRGGYVRAPMNAPKRSRTGISGVLDHRGGAVIAVQVPGLVQIAARRPRTGPGSGPIGTGELIERRGHVRRRRAAGRGCAAGRRAHRRPGAAGRGGTRRPRPQCRSARRRPGRRSASGHSAAPVRYRGTDSDGERCQLIAAADGCRRTAGDRLRRRQPGRPTSAARRRFSSDGRPGDGQELADPVHRRRLDGDQLLPAPPQLPQVPPRLIQLLRDIAVQLNSQPGDHHAIGLIGLMGRIVLLLPGDMAHQRPDATAAGSSARGRDRYGAARRLDAPQRARSLRHRGPGGSSSQATTRSTSPPRASAGASGYARRRRAPGHGDPDHRAITRQRPRMRSGAVRFRSARVG